MKAHFKLGYVTYSTMWTTSVYLLALFAILVRSVAWIIYGAPRKCEYAFIDLSMPFLITAFTYLISASWDITVLSYIPKLWGCLKGSKSIWS